MELVVSLIALVAFATSDQEEDRDRLWSWAEPVEPEEVLVDVQELVDVREQAVSVSRVR